MKTFVFDLDGTLCTQPHPTEFSGAQPIPDRIARVNELYKAGHRIVIDTARGSRTGQAWRAETQRQLAAWGVLHHELRVGEKPGAEVYVDDRAIPADIFFCGGAGLQHRRERSETLGHFVGEYADHLYWALKAVPPLAVEALASVLEGAQLRGASTFIVANGGSAASAQHMANGLGAYLQRRAGRSFRLRALTENVAALTGQANDAGFDNVFVDQLAAQYRIGDVLLAISCSGNSRNILRAAEFVRERGGMVVGLLGFDGGQLMGLCDMSVLVPTAPGEYGPVEDAHMAIAHALVHWYQDQ